MNFEMQKAIMLAENINAFIIYAHKCYEHKNSFILNRDKLYQVKLLVEEFKFQTIADELLRINQYNWDEKSTYYLVDKFIKGIHTIDEYVKNNHNDLFILAARIHTLMSLSLSFNRSNNVSQG
jgi:hypothetical protein